MKLSLFTFTMLVTMLNAFVDDNDDDYHKFICSAENQACDDGGQLITEHCTQFSGGGCTKSICEEACNNNVECKFYGFFTIGSACKLYSGCSNKVSNDQAGFCIWQRQSLKDTCRANTAATTDVNGCLTKRYWDCRDAPQCGMQECVLGEFKLLESPVWRAAKGLWTGTQKVLEAEKFTAYEAMATFPYNFNGYKTFTNVDIEDNEMYSLDVFMYQALKPSQCSKFAGQKLPESDTTTHSQNWDNLSVECGKHGVAKLMIRTQTASDCLGNTEGTTNIMGTDYTAYTNVNEADLSLKYRVNGLNDGDSLLRQERLVFTDDSRTMTAQGINDRTATTYGMNDGVKMSTGDDGQIWNDFWTAVSAQMKNWCVDRFVKVNQEVELLSLDSVSHVIHFLINCFGSTCSDGSNTGVQEIIDNHFTDPSIYHCCFHGSTYNEATSKCDCLEGWIGDHCDESDGLPLCQSFQGEPSVMQVAEGQQCKDITDNCCWSRGSGPDGGDEIMTWGGLNAEYRISLP